MLSNLPRVALLLLAGFGCSTTGCRALNPNFGDLEPGRGSDAVVDDPREDPTSTQVLTSAGISSPSAPDSTSTQAWPSNSGQSTTSWPVASSSESMRPDDSTSSNPGSTETDSLTSSTSSSSTSSTTTTDPVPAMRWDAQGPPADSNAQATDYCAKGATTCYIIRPNAQARIASGTPGHEDIRLVIENTLNLSSYEVQRSPTGSGLGFDGSAARLESEIDFPVYAGQDFGIEVLYRRDPYYSFVNEKKMMLAQVHRKIWLHEWKDGGISCFLTNSIGESGEMQHVYKPPSNQMDILRHILCFVHDGKAHLLINGVYQSAGNGTASNNSFFKIPESEPTGELTLGKWAQADSGAANHFVPFKGVMYLARTWNNVTKMKNAVMQELPEHGFSNLDFSSFTPQ